MDNLIIESARYIVDSRSGNNSSITATIDGVELSVPLDPANRHYAAIMQAVADKQLTIAEAAQ